MTLLTRGERLAGILNVNRLIRTDLAAIPQVALIGGEFFRRTGDENLTRRLPRATS